MCTKVYSVELDFYNFKGFSFMREQDKEKAILILIACHTSQLLEELRALKGKKYKNS